MRSTKLHEVINSIYEYRIFSEIESLKESIELFELNYRELSRFFENYRRTVTDNDKNINIESKRLIHNYLSSAVSLIDHTRICINSLHLEHYRLEYQQKMINSFDNKLCAFVKELRNYVQHFKLPLISYQKNAFSIKPHASLVVSKAELLKFSGWKKNAKSYINEYIGHIDLRMVLKQYQSIVEDFYTWLISWQQNIFESEIKIIDEIRKCLDSNLLYDIKIKILYLRYKNYHELEYDLKAIIPLKMMALLKLSVKERNEEIIRLVDIEESNQFFFDKILNE